MVGTEWVVPPARRQELKGAQLTILARHGHGLRSRGQGRIRGAHASQALKHCDGIPNSRSAEHGEREKVEVRHSKRINSTQCRCGRRSCSLSLRLIDWRTEAAGVLKLTGVSGIALWVSTAFQPISPSCRGDARTRRAVDLRGGDCSPTCDSGHWSP